MTATTATPARELSALLGLRYFGCGGADIMAVAPGLENQTAAGFTYQRGQDVRGWCARCRFKAAPVSDATPREEITMPRKKTESWAETPEYVAPAPVEPGEDAGYVSENDAAVQDMAAETLTGDMRDFILDRLKHEQSKRPWHERSEADQRATVQDVEIAVRASVTRAIEIIAGEGKKSIKATLDSVTVKDGIKASLSLSKFDPHRFGLIDATGHAVLIIVADPDEFTGERAPAEISPDQATMLGDGVMVQHSPVDGAETPFH